MKQAGIAWLAALGLCSGLAQAAPPQAQLCTSCHGAQGQGVPGLAPALAGLSADYIAHQIELFQQGKRQNVSMRPMAMALQGDAVRKVAEHYAQLPAPGVKLKLRGEQVVFSEPGEKLAYQGDWSRELPSCVSCHGPSGVGGGMFPRLAGQHQDYLQRQLEDWQAGKRSGDPDGMMQQIAGKLTADEIQAVTEYFANLK